MIQETVTRSAIAALIGHLARWVANLDRAGAARKRESRESLKQVVLAVRKTAVYGRSLDAGEARNFDREAEIAMQWTALAIELERLGLGKLAKKCRVTGWYWENQARFDAEFLERAQVRLDQVERLALALLADIER